MGVTAHEISTTPSGWFFIIPAQINVAHTHSNKHPSTIRTKHINVIAELPIYTPRSDVPDTVFIFTTPHDLGINSA